MQNIDGSSKAGGHFFRQVSAVCTVALMVLFPSILFSQNYLVDFSVFENPNSGGATHVWNALSSVQTNVVLVDDGGGPSGVTLSHDLQADNNGSAGWNVGNVDWVDTRAVDGLYSGSIGTVTFSGLNDGFFYGLDVIALESAFPSTADIRVQGNFADSNRLGTSALGDDWHTFNDGADNWLIWGSVMPSSGSITLQITSVSPGSYSTLSAIRLRTLGPSNTPPTAAGFTANPTEGQTHVFATADFGYSDTDGDTLDHLIIEQVALHGVLYVDGNGNDQFDAGEALTNAALVTKNTIDNGHLQYIQNDSMSTTIQFEVHDGTASSTGDYLIQVNVTPVAATVNTVSVPASDTYVESENLNFTVNFSKPVDVVGSPALRLTVGASVVDATYVSGTGTSDLLFRYVVQDGDEDGDGVAVNALELQGGGITSNGGLAADLTLNAVGSTAAVLVDGVAPRIDSVVRHNPMSSPTSADQVTLRYTFTEAVTGVQDFNFASNNPSVITAIAANAVSGSVYDVTFGGPALAEFNGSIAFGVIISGISDSPGNPMTNAAVIGTNDNSYVFENLYFIGGTVNGLLKGNYLVLTNNGGDDEVIMGDGIYVFDTPLAHQADYLVEIDLQPNDPVQPCVVSNGDSSINGADVIDIDVTCEVGTDLIFRDGFELIDMD